MSQYQACRLGLQIMRLNGSGSGLMLLLMFNLRKAWTESNALSRSLKNSLVTDLN